MTTKSMNRLSLFSENFGTVSSTNYAYRNKFSTIRTENDKIEFLRKLSRDYLKDFGIKKIVIAVYNEDGSHKSLYLRGDMVARDFLVLALEKNFPQIKLSEQNRELCEMMFRWQIFEVLGDITNYVRPIYDHENIVEIFESWPDRNNEFKFLLKENPNKFSCVRNLKLPIDKVNANLSHDEELNWLLPSTINQDKPYLDNKGGILKEIAKKRCYTTKGYLWIKKATKPWKRKFCFISLGNLFYSKNAKSTSSKDMSLIFDMENGYFYSGIDRDAILNFAHSIKAPSPHILIFRARVNYPMENDNICGICFKSDQELKQWQMALTILKFGWKNICEDYTIANDLKNYRRPSEISLNGSHHNMMENSCSERRKVFSRTPLPDETRDFSSHLTKSQTSLFMTEANEIISRLDEINEDAEEQSTSRNDTFKCSKRRSYELLEKDPNTKILEDGGDVLFLYSESFPASTNHSAPTVKRVLEKKLDEYPTTISEETEKVKSTNGFSEKELNYKAIRSKVRNDIGSRLKSHEKTSTCPEYNGHMKNTPYYFGLMSIDETTNYLEKHGDFIIHDSRMENNEKKTYLTGMLEDNSIAHIEINITHDKETKYLYRLANKNEVFASIHELVSYYKANSHLLPIKMSLEREVMRKKKEASSKDYTIHVDSRSKSLKILKKDEEVKKYSIKRFSDGTFGIENVEQRFPSVYKLAAYMEDNFLTIL